MGLTPFCRHLDKPLEFIRNIHGDEINYSGGKRSLWKCPICGQEIYRSEEFDQGSVSDGYHTFDELYHHRTLLFATICNANPDISWKSKHHEDGTMYDGMFIAGIKTPEGDATYHCEGEYWDKFNVPELEHAPKFDGHTPEQAVNRIYRLKIKR